MNAAPHPKLTIGMATIDDFEGVYFTVTSLMIHHAEAISECEIVVVDNNPSSKHGQLVKSWVLGNIPQAAYFPFEEATGTAQARNEIFHHARAAAVLCLDCHVLLAPGAVRRLIDYHLAHPDARDLLSGPLLADGGKLAATQQRPRWSNGAWGVWSKDPRGEDPDGEPFEIWQQGMGLFSCRKDAWVGFHREFRGFGGCESYVMEKFRRNGGRVLCCPWLRWTHRFQRPHGIPYPIDRQDSLRNYLIGFQELALDLEPVKQHFQVSDLAVARILERRVNRPDDCVVVGDPAFGGVRMRGWALAKHLSCELLTPRQAIEMRPTHTVIAVKVGCEAAEIRKKCERLIYDPLDVFADSYSRAKPEDYWRQMHRELRFDDILATSPACYETMRAALPDRCRVHLVPHPCDGRVNESWREPAGPVVYAGLVCFIDSGLDRIQQACQWLGKELVMGENCDALRGASLALALRLPPYDTALNRNCKPQIKLENAAAAGLPAVTSDCPAATSLHSKATTVPPDFSAAQLADAMRRALAGPPLSGACREGQYLAAMDRILDRPAIVVYTAIFGGVDMLQAPHERQSGVQYVCFTDNPRLKSESWEVRYCRPIGDPLMQAKRFKILAHESLDCDFSLWLDGSIELFGLNGAIERCNTDLGLTRHPSRNCIYAEANHCLSRRRGNPERIRAAIERYQAEGHPEEYGLWRGGVILRRHTAAAARFNREWWREVESGTTRDQISLPVVLRRLGMQFDTLPSNAPQFYVGEHAG